MAVRRPLTGFKNLSSRLAKLLVILLPSKLRLSFAICLNKVPAVKREKNENTDPNIFAKGTAMLFIVLAIIINCGKNLTTTPPSKLITTRKTPLRNPPKPFLFLDSGFSIS